MKMIEVALAVLAIVVPIGVGVLAMVSRWIYKVSRGFEEMRVSNARIETRVDGHDKELEAKQVQISAVKEDVSELKVKVAKVSG